MISKQVHQRSAVDDSPSASEAGYDSDLSTPPEAYMPPSPADNSSAMLGYTPEDEEESGELPPSEGGIQATALGMLGMAVQGLQGLGSLIPGFVPMEVTAWLQQAMQQLPAILQSMSSGLAAASSGAAGSPMGGMAGGMPGQGMGGGGMTGGSAPASALGPSESSSSQSQPPQKSSRPSGPPRSK